MSIKTCTKTIEIEVTESLACDNCGANIPLVFPEGVTGRTMQGDDALKIIFEGGYGMYIDPYGQPDPHMLWCKDCADKLIAAFPSIAARIR